MPLDAALSRIAAEAVPPDRKAGADGGLNNRRSCARIERFPADIRPVTSRSHGRGAAGDNLVNQMHTPLALI